MHIWLAMQVLIRWCLLICNDEYKYWCCGSSGITRQYRNAKIRYSLVFCGYVITIARLVFVQCIVMPKCWYVYYVSKNTTSFWKCSCFNIDRRFQIVLILIWRSIAELRLHWHFFFGPCAICECYSFWKDPFRARQSQIICCIGLFGTHIFILMSDILSITKGRFSDVTIRYYALFRTHIKL